MTPLNLPAFWQKRQASLKTALLLFLALRLFLTGWSVLAVALVPIPTTPDEAVRPYLGADILTEGPAGLLLGPWQRFDANRYLRIARQGYAAVEDSVFPPLYPLLIRAVSELLPIPSPTTAGMTATGITAGILISNLACLGVFYLLHRQTVARLGANNANRALIYFALFPTAFFLFAPYTESLFIFWVLASLSSAEQGKWARAGIFAALSALTRAAGVLLIIPLAYAAWQTRPRWQPLLWSALPAVAFLAFLAYRHWLGLPPINQVYAQFWHQTTALPGADLLAALSTLLTGQGARAGEITLIFDFLTPFLLLAATIIAFRRYGATIGLYAAAMLLFILLPHSQLKPLYSFTRYALPFFPLFWWAAEASQTPWPRRLILYPSLLLYLYLSGQFFLWGWVG